jgi:hypothetical protein
MSEIYISKLDISKPHSLPKQRRSREEKKSMDYKMISFTADTTTSNKNENLRVFALIENLLQTKRVFLQYSVT